METQHQDQFTLEAVGVALRKRLASLPAGSAELTREIGDDGIEYWVVSPANPEAARVVVYVEPDGHRAYVGLGHRIDLEVDSPAREGSTAPLDELMEYCDAAIEGRVEETVWRHGDSIWRSRGRIDLRTRVLKPTTIEGFSLGRLRRGTREHYGYAPYAAGGPDGRGETG